MVSINIFIEYSICWIVIWNYFISFVLSFFYSISNFFCFCKFVSTFTCFSYRCVSFYLFNISVFILVNKCCSCFLDSCIGNYIFVIFISCCCCLYRNFFYTCNVTFFLRDCYFRKSSISVTNPVNVDWFSVSIYFCLIFSIYLDSTCIAYSLICWFKYLLSCKILNIVCVNILNRTIYFFYFCFLNIVVYNIVYKGVWVNTIRLKFFWTIDSTRTFWTNVNCSCCSFSWNINTDVFNAINRFS